MTTNDFDIDLVYLWVDGNDPVWQAKKAAATGKLTPQQVHVDNEAEGKCRYADNDELKYSLRSAEKFAPWIRHIYIVTDGQVPSWLDRGNPKVEIIDHKEIIPHEVLPCFNSNVIEQYIYKIPGLVEHFLYANDDTFFAGSVEPSFFFGEDGYPIVRLKPRPLGPLHYYVKFLRGKSPGTYRKTIHRAARLVQRRFGKYYGGLPHHNIDSYLKSDFAEVIEHVFAEQARNTATHSTRHEDDMQRVVQHYYALAVGHAHLRRATPTESMRIPIQRNGDYMERLLKFKPELVCLNDSQRVSDEDRRRIQPLLQKLFPDKSQFEK